MEIQYAAIVPRLNVAMARPSCCVKNSPRPTASSGAESPFCTLSEIFSESLCSSETPSTPHSALTHTHTLRRTRTSTCNAQTCLHKYYPLRVARRKIRTLIGSSEKENFANALRITLGNTRTCATHESTPTKNGRKHRHKQTQTCLAWSAWVISTPKKKLKVCFVEIMFTPMHVVIMARADEMFSNFRLTHAVREASPLYRDNKAIPAFLTKHQTTAIWQRCAVCRKICAFWQFHTISKHSIISHEPHVTRNACKNADGSRWESHADSSSRRRVAIGGRADAAAATVVDFFPTCFRLHTSTIHPLVRRSEHGAHGRSLVGAAQTGRQLQRRVLSVLLLYLCSERKSAPNARYRMDARRKNALVLFC